MSAIASGLLLRKPRFHICSSNAIILRVLSGKVRNRGRNPGAVRSVAVVARLNAFGGVASSRRAVKLFLSLFHSQS
jgi:hypothetical protein